MGRKPAYVDALELIGRMTVEKQSGTVQLRFDGGALVDWEATTMQRVTSGARRVRKKAKKRGRPPKR